MCEAGYQRFFLLVKFYNVKELNNKLLLLSLLVSVVQSFLTELATGKRQLDEISCLADMFSKSSPGKQNEIHVHQKEINVR